jgi:VanZ family protein
MKNSLYKLSLFITLGVIEFLATTTIEIKVVESSWDKANHFTAFFVLYILLSLAYQNFDSGKKFLLLLAFGMQIEIVQLFIEGRSFSLYDVVADCVGIVLGIVFYKYGVSKITILHKAL